MLSIKDLHVRVGEAEIIKGLSLDLPAGQVHAVMGPNGAGKSTLAYALAGRPGYEVTAGSTTYDGEDLLSLTPDQRAARGVFLSFQYPLELPGVPGLTFLRTALNAQRKARGEDEIAAPAFLKLARDKAAALKIDFDMLRRPLNVGFSGGEKKRMEIFQMSLFAPRLLVLDETEFRPRYRRAARGGRRGQRRPRAGCLDAGDHPLPAPARLYPARPRPRAGRWPHRRLGGPELAHELEREGYDKYARVAA